MAYFQKVHGTHLTGRPHHPNEIRTTQEWDVELPAKCALVSTKTELVWRAAASLWVTNDRQGLTQILDGHEWLGRLVMANQGMSTPLVLTILPEYVFFPLAAYETKFRVEDVPGVE